MQSDISGQLEKKVSNCENRIQRSWKYTGAGLLPPDKKVNRQKKGKRDK